MLLDGKDMLIVSVQGAQGFSKLQQIVPVTAAGTVAGGNVTGNQQLVALAEKGGIVLGGDVDQAVSLIAIGEGQRGAKSQITIFLPMVQMLEHIRGDAVGHPGAEGARCRYQGNHTARVFRGAAMVVGSLPEAARPVADGSGAAFQKGKIRLVDQRAVAKQPHWLVRIQRVAPAVFCRGVEHTFLDPGSVSSRSRRYTPGSVSLPGKP